MQLKNYHQVQNVISFITLIGLYFCLTGNHYFIAVLIMILAYIGVYVIRKTVKDVVLDERDQALNNQAFRVAVYGYAVLATITIILLSLGSLSKPEYSAIFITFIVSITIIFFLQKLFYIYYQKFIHLEKKGIYIVFGVGIILVLLIGMLRFFNGEDDWICKEGKWVAHGHPQSAMPISECK
ncbi:MAG: DUF2178 domain-containing protein [Patescibacteria group bacterium]